MKPELLLTRTLTRPAWLTRTPWTQLLLTFGAVVVVPALAAAQTTTQVVEYYHTDAIGSVRAVTKQVNGQWQVVARHDFMPFGEEVAPQNPPQDKRLFTGKERDSETGQDYFEARYLRVSIGRFTSPDPVRVRPDRLLDPQRLNSYSYVANNPLGRIDPDGRDAIAVVFPDYKIQTPLGKIGNLGHAGVVTIDSSGRAKYFEYGRYDKAGKGLVREVRLDPVVMGSDGKPTAESLNGVMKVVSREAGNRGKIEGAYFATDDKQTAAMNQYAEGREAQNGDPNRESYDLQTNNCATFMDKTLEAGGAKLPPNLGARPNGQIAPIQNAAGNKVEYEPAKGQATITPLKKKEEHP
jgi:RHS repeat-associated protein